MTLVFAVSWAPVARLPSEAPVLLERAEELERIDAALDAARAYAAGNRAPREVACETRRRSAPWVPLRDRLPGRTEPFVSDAARPSKERLFGRGIVPANPWALGRA